MEVGSVASSWVPVRLCADEDKMASALSRVGEFVRPACRSAAALRFSAARMVNDHRPLYRSLIAERGSADVIDLAPSRSRRAAEVEVFTATAGD